MSIEAVTPLWKQLLNGGTPFARRLGGLDKSGLDQRLVLNPANMSLAVKDQLLISVSASPVAVGHTPVTPLGASVRRFLNSNGVKPRLLTTVFAGLPNPRKIEDVAIIQVTPPRGESVFTLAQQLRRQVLAKVPAKASPNHVMIPAANELWCPSGPPKPVPSVQPPSPTGNPGVDITVIDSGYIWSPPSPQSPPGPPWGPNGSPTDNPLHNLCGTYLVHEADWLKLGPGGTTASWQSGSPNVTDANQDQKLDALAGHANFVAGVIGQHSELPNVHIWNHNSGFVPKPFDNFTTEAAICRSLVMSQQDTVTPVIQIGHASPFLGNIASEAWKFAFARIAYYHHNLNDELVLTCPAGNQGLLPQPLPTIPRFPAALNAGFPFVKGVASVTPSGTRSGFSNHGAWVVCAAVGQDVVSSFLYVDMPVEEDTTPTSTVALPPSQNFKPNSWALWNGTSFAAPKVAGEVAARLSSSVNAGLAWSTLAACATCNTTPDLGKVFSF